MFKFEARDKSGPMDLDPVDHQSRLEAFAIPGPEEGPSRKRIHAELSTPTRALPAANRPLHFGTNTPFIFHTANLPKPASSYKPYDPSEWVGADFSMGRSGTTPQPVRHYYRGESGEGDVDVEMRWGDSPARGAEAGPSNAGSTSTKKGQDKGEGEERPMAQGAVSRMRKKRQKEWRRRRDSGSTNGDGEERMARQEGTRKTEHTYNFNVPNPSLRHSEIPALLLGYLQFFVNAAVVVFVLNFAVQFVLTVRNDVKDRMKEYSVEALQEIAECTKLYLTNRCDPVMRVPAMEAPCKAWEACMARDPTIVGRTNVVAETFAGVINSFVDPISWKTMGFTLVTLSFLIILTNSALWNLRGKVAPHPEPPMPAYPAHHALMPQGWHPQMQHPQHPQVAGEGQPVPGAIGWQDEKKSKSWW